MTSNGPSTSPPRAVVAHRAREGDDTDREPNQHQHKHQHQHQHQHVQDHQQVEGTVREGGSDERRQSWGGRDERDDRQGQNGRDGRDRGRDGRGRDSRNDRDSQRKARRSGGGGGGGGNNNQHNQQTRNRSPRERSRSRGRHDSPASAARGEAAETRPSTGPIKRPRSPSPSFGVGPGSGGASTQSQNKRSRLDAYDTRGGRPRSQTPPPYHAQQHASSRRYSSRSPAPHPSATSRRDRRSKNKNKTRYPAVAGATGGEGEPRRLSSTHDSTFPLKQHEGSGSPGRPGSNGEGDIVPYIGSSNADQELFPTDTRASDDALHRPLSTTGRSRSTHDRDTGRDKDRDRERRDRDRGRDRDRARGRDRDRERGRDRSKGHDKERDRDYNRDHDRDRNRDRERDRDRDRDRDRNRGRDNRGRSPHSRKKKGNRRDYSRTSQSADPAANADQSADADMGARSRYRGGRGRSPCSSREQYALQQHKQQQQKRRQHPNSQSDHATPNTSFNGSPPSQHSPYGEPQGWPAGHQQYSPQTHDTAQQYGHGYAPSDAPQGPSAYHHGNSPPLDAPTGPGGQYAQYAGAGPAHGKDRGHPYAQGPDHSGHRNGQWDAGPGPAPADVYSHSLQQESHERGHEHHHGHSGQGLPYFEDDGDYMQDPNYSQAQHSYHQYQAGPEQPLGHPDDGAMGRHGYDRDMDMGRDRRDDQMPPPSRPPPSGSQSKFSFAFKATSKPAVTAPKAEIAQKLSNAVPRQPQQPLEEDNVPAPSTPSHSGSLQLRPFSSESRKSFPRNAPTEPASSRARSDARQRGPPSGAPSGPSAGSGPRYRKVKQIVRRPKPRLTLPEEMAASESVYYRKPGNESIIGSGTYGQVFKAVHVYTKQLAALKKIRMDGEREGLPVTAIREIKLLQSLHHVNIVELLEVMVEEGHCYMVFEYLAHDLNGLLNHPTFKLDAAQKKHLGLQMFQGLDYLHRRGVLHRDIKAANILVSSDGTLKIADFGLARFFAKRHQLDYTNRVITIWYRPPELLLGETQYGAAVDMWSAACVLVEIFTRYPIFPGDGGEISQINKVYGLLGTPSKSDWPGLVDMPWFELLRPSHRLPNKLVDTYAQKVSPAALDLLVSMLQYDPAKRPSAAEVLKHPYFTQEEPAPRQAIELATIGGDWHEFDSKALRKENERKAKEAKEKEAKEAKEVKEKEAQADTAKPDQNERKKRPPPTAADGADADKADDETTQPEAKRQHVERADESKADALPQPGPAKEVDEKPTSTAAVVPGEAGHGG